MAWHKQSVSRKEAWQLRSVVHVEESRGVSREVSRAKTITALGKLLRC
jgi:hypothetical protein